MQRWPPNGNHERLGTNSYIAVKSQEKKKAFARGVVFIEGKNYSLTGTAKRGRWNQIVQYMRSRRLHMIKKSHGYSHPSKIYWIYEKSLSDCRIRHLDSQEIVENWFSDN